MAKSRTASRKKNSKFHMEFLNTHQQIAYGAYQQHDIIFLLGPAGVGKTHLAMSFAINDILAGDKSKVVLTRPIVEAGESLGYLPGDFEEKVNPYMLPMFDCLEKMVGKGETPQKDTLKRAIEVAPLAYMRGRTFDDSVCIFDEAQNATKTQLKLFLSRLGKDSKMIITGDPNQSDRHSVGDVHLEDVVHRLENVKGVSIIRFDNSAIVRHELVGKILDKLV